MSTGRCATQGARARRRARAVVLSMRRQAARRVGAPHLISAVGGIVRCHSTLACRVCDHLEPYAGAPMRTTA